MQLKTVKWLVIVLVIIGSTALTIWQVKISHANNPRITSPLGTSTNPSEESKGNEAVKTVYFPNLIPNPGFEKDVDKDLIPDFWKFEKNNGGQFFMFDK